MRPEACHRLSWEGKKPTISILVIARGNATRLRACWLVSDLKKQVVRLRFLAPFAGA